MNLSNNARQTRTNQTIVTQTTLLCKCKKLDNDALKDIKLNLNVMLETYSGKRPRCQFKFSMDLHRKHYIKN